MCIVIYIVYYVNNVCVCLLSNHNIMILRDYNPAFSPTFDDPDLEQLAVEICGDSLFCLFDIAATKRPEIGMTTAVDNENYEIVVNMSLPGISYSFRSICNEFDVFCIIAVTCHPPCENGACVATNTCVCTDGYIGDTCFTAGNDI